MRRVPAKEVIALTYYKYHARIESSRHRGIEASKHIFPARVRFTRKLIERFMTSSGMRPLPAVRVFEGGSYRII